MEKCLHGRRMILTNATEITSENIADVLKKAIAVHTQNALEIQYLWNYYTGIQPILERTKDVRPEINNKIIENRAAEIVNLKTGYLMREPVKYISKSKKIREINLLNDFSATVEKDSKDREISDFMHICGTSYKMILPNADDTEESPFEIDVLQPESTFVVYENNIRKKPILGVTYFKDDNRNIHYYCYSKDMYYEIVNFRIVSSESHILGDIPIIEYPLNLPRMGIIELVISLLDAINLTTSNQEDGLEQFIQALLLFHNVEIDAAGIRELKDLGAVKYRDVSETMKGEITYLTSILNQGETNALVTRMYQDVLEICGMPSQSDGNSSDSSNNGAVVLKNGWYSAETMAVNTELLFKKSERRLLKIALNICRILSDIDLKLSDIKIKFTRRNYENVQTKAQVLVSMLSCEKIHPKLAFEYCGMFTDPDEAYEMSEQYLQELERKKLNDNNRTSEGATAESHQRAEPNRSSPAQNRERETGSSESQEN